MEKKEKNIIKSGIKLSILTLISRVLGVIRESTKGHFLGTSGYADAFTVAFLIPNLFRRLFAENSISVAFIPTFKAYLEEKENKKETQNFINSTFTLITFATTLTVIIGILFLPIIVPLFYNESNQIVISETIILTRIMFPYLITISIAALFQGILNSINIFSPSGFTPILFNIFTILGTIFLSKYTSNPARAMSIGILMGGIMQAAFQLPFIIKNDWSIGFTPLKKAFTNNGTKKVIALIIPTILGMATHQLNDVISTALAGRAGEGVASSLQYSLRLQELILGIFAVSIGTVLLPDLADLAKHKKWNDYGKMLTSAVKIIALICIPITFYSIITGKEIISLVFKSKAFNDHSVQITLNVFIFHLIGLFPIAANRIISPAFYAQGNTKLPTLAGIISLGIDIILTIILSHYFKGPGIALALTLASFINTILLFNFLSFLKTVDTARICKSLILYCLKIILFSFIAAIPIYFLHPIFVEKFIGLGRFLGNGIPLIISCIIFFTCGIILLLITKDEILISIMNKLKIRIKSKE